MRDVADTLVDVAEPGGNCTNTGASRLYTTADSIPASSNCTAVALDNNANPTALEYPGGLGVVYTRDNDGRPLNITARFAGASTNLFSQTLAYQTSGAPGTDTSLLQTINDSDNGNTTYQYDSLNRLTSAQTAGYTHPSTWTYDAAGNRTSYSNAGSATVHYAYNPSNELSETGTTTIATVYTGACSAGTVSGGNNRYAYDGDGNQTAGGANSSTYNGASQTTGVVPGSYHPTNVPYTYAGTSQVERHTVGTTGYASGLVAQNGQASRVVSGATDAYVTRTPAGTPIGLRSGAGAGSTNYYYVLDYLGSERYLVQSGSSSYAQSNAYDAYGNATLTRTGSGVVTLNPVGYTGGITDSATGLTKLGTGYDPSLGRFTQLDATGSSPGYTYAADAPTIFTDPSGENILDDIGSFFSEHAIDIAAGAAGAAVGAAVAFIPGVGPAVAAAAGGCASGAVDSALKHGANLADAFSECIEGAIIGLIGGVAGNVAKNLIAKAIPIINNLLP